MRSQWWFAAGTNIVPLGLIIPFDDVAANIPSGWTQWTTGADRALVGHTSDYNTTGGSLYVVRDTATGGGHTEDQYTGWMTASGGSGSDRAAYSNRGDHSHDNMRINFKPARRYQIMMKATEDHIKFPAKSGILSNVDLNSLYGLTDITDVGLMLYAADGASSSNSALSKSLSNINTTGSHDHLSGEGTAENPNTAYATNYTQGSSNHSQASCSVSDSIYRYYMGMWSDASSEVDLKEGMFGIWESATPPNGWAICDGDNGTPDLTDYHIGLDSGAALGTKTGAGTINTSGVTTYNGSHNHRGASGSRGSSAPTHHAGNVTHRHTIGSQNDAFEPQNITAIFIKFIG